MDIKSFINQKEFNKISKCLQSIKDEIASTNFNLLSISSYNSYLENFHSDIIAILLNPKEKHKQNNLFLNLFLDYLIGEGILINKEDYVLCEITREKGRIDIWIKDNTSKKSIIIENKINNAIDPENQLENYYNYAKKEGFDVDVIVYLTLNGNKNAPLTDDLKLNKKIINISAFTNNQNDLCNGWLQKCYEKVNDEDNRSLIFQYIKLIKNLSQKGMDKQINDDFYSLLNIEDGFKKAQTIAELLEGLGKYRADLFATKINNEFFPFKKIYRYRPHYWLFENYKDNNIIFKLDVYFLSDGSARIDFWNPSQPEDIQKQNTSKKLKSIGLFEEFEFGGFGGGMFKIFNLEKFNTIENIDNALYNFVNNLFEKLK